MRRTISERVGLSVAAVAVGSDLIGSLAGRRLWAPSSYFLIFALGGVIHRKCVAAVLLVKQVPQG